MYNLNNLKELLESGIITNEEYTMITKRIDIASDKYKQTWEDMLNDFYEWCMKNYALVTAKGYKTCLYKFVTWLTKETDTSSALRHKFKTYSFVEVNSFIIDLQENGFSGQSISKIKYSIAMFGNFLKESGFKAPNISDIKVSIKDEVNKTTHVFHNDEIMEIASTSDLRNKVCIMLCYEGCLRRNEIINIKINDFDFAKRQLFIRNNENVIDRVCILSSSTVDDIKEYIGQLYNDIANWNKSRLKRGKEIREDLGYIFQTVKMTIPSYSVVHTMLKDSARAYYTSLGLKDIELDDKISKFTFESIRNSRKVYLLSKGINISDVMAMSGDKNYMSTYRFVKMIPMLYPETIKTI